MRANGDNRELRSGTVSSGAAARICPLAAMWDGEAVEVLEEVVGHEPGMAAGRGVAGGEDLELVCRP